jgi:hypothetical protein
MGRVTGGMPPKLRRLPTEYRRLVKAALDAGYTFSVNGSDHYTVRDADGNRVTWLSGSPRPNPRDFLNFRAALRRSGLDV